MRLVTLCGAGGVGKTRLALEAARAELFSRRVVWASLAPLRDPGLIGSTLCQAAGVTVLPGEDALLSLLAHFLREEEPLLLLLDNCEKLLPEVAFVVQTLLASAPRLAIVATSRAPLGVPGERVLRVASFPVPVLEVQSETPDLSELQSQVSVCLFVDRVQTRRAEFELSPSTPGRSCNWCANSIGTHWPLNWSPRAPRICRQRRFCFSCKRGRRKVLRRMVRSM